MANWTRPEVLAAMHLYTQLPFGKLHRRNPAIIELADRMGRTPSSVAMKLTNIASLDPLITASGRKGLSGASELDREVWDDMARQWDVIATEAYAAYRHWVVDEQSTDLPDVDVPRESTALPDFPDGFRLGVTRNATVAVRVNQRLFRRAVLASYRERCCITGLVEPGLLVASHIVPWCVDSQNRLNPCNGLCLSALHDKAFDLGLITVMPGDLKVRVAKKLLARHKEPYLSESLLKYDGQPICLPQRYRPGDDFLRWHADHFGFG